MTDDELQHVQAPEISAPRRQVPRRLRFEILRRDGHTCRYCGAMAPDVKLTVDHVVPVALGGSDDPTNLVTACTDCNAGKTSTSPDEALVNDVAVDALRWARALEAAATNKLAERELIAGFVARFQAKWNEWATERIVIDPPAPYVPTGDVLVDNWADLGYSVRQHSRPIGFDGGTLSVLVEKGYVVEVRQDLRYVATRRTLGRLLGAAVEEVAVHVADIDWPGPLPSRPLGTRRADRIPYPLPTGWQNSVERFYSLGLPESEIHRLVDVTMQALPQEPFRFLCGCCWRAITDLQEDARRFIEAEDL